MLVLWRTTTKTLFHCKSLDAILLPEKEVIMQSTLFMSLVEK